MAIIDWEYYNSHFPRVMPESEFAPVETQAEAEFNRIVPTYLQDTLTDAVKQNCIFAVCNHLYNQAQGSAGSGVTSVSNNGYSESYAVTTQEQAETELRELIYSKIGTRLAGAF